MGKLTRMWNKFRYITDKIALLSGNYSQTHKKYKGNNCQAAATCVFACALAQVESIESWKADTLDLILEMGSKIHTKTLREMSNKCYGFIEPGQVNRHIFFANSRLTMKILPKDGHLIMLHPDKNILISFEQKVASFLKNNSFFVISCMKKCYALWKKDQFYYIFNPLDHDLNGSQWIGIPGQGRCQVLMSKQLRSLTDTIFPGKSAFVLRKDIRVRIFQCDLEKATEINTKPPETLEELEKPKTEITPPFKESTRLPIKKKEIIEEVPKSEEPQPVPIDRKTQLKSVTNFQPVDSFVSILRGTTHQAKPFFKHLLPNELSLTIAIITLGMLRIMRAKLWNRNTIDTMFLLSEQFYQPKPYSEIDHIELFGKKFKPRIKKFSISGQLTATKENIIDLKIALINFFASIGDCGIIIGPIIVPFWLEDSRYYILDSNSRDEQGLVTHEDIGVGCVLAFESIQKLVEHYMKNVPREKLRYPFRLDAIEIVDYEPIPENWYNFRGIAPQKWILQGTFSQNSKQFGSASRGTQCTANATMSLVYKQLREEKDWDSKTLDEVLISGDAFYRKCVQDLKDKGKYHHNFLMVDELQRKLSLENIQINLEIDDCLVNGILNAKSEMEVPNLRKGFVEFFSHSDAGVVTANNLSMAVWKRDEIFYYFDSHSRDEKGLCSNFGTSCVLRVVNVEDLAKSIMSNLPPPSDNLHRNLFNISRIIVHQIEKTEEGIVLPPMNNYQPLNDFIGILRAEISQDSVDKFKLNAGKQTIPTCLTAICLNNITPAFEWNEANMEQILIEGDKLYRKSMLAILTEEGIAQPQPASENAEVEDDEPGTDDVISTENVKTEFRIGSNKFEVQFGDASIEGTIGEELVERLNEALGGEENFVGLFESEYYTAAVFRDENNLLYAFDPKARDSRGGALNKDEWSSLEVEDIEEQNEGEKLIQVDDGNENEENEVKGNEEAQQDAENVEESQKEVYEDAQVDRFEKTAPDIEGTGKACILRFSKIEDFHNHVLENTPPKLRSEATFTLKPIQISNVPCVKVSPELDGDWNEFKEVDHGSWCLRGTLNCESLLFPVHNRGKQILTTSLTFLTYSYVYDIATFKQSTVDKIVSYGDRLLTSMKRARREKLQSMKGELALNEDEIDHLVENDTYTVENMPKKLCMGETMVENELKMREIEGDLNSKIDPVFDVYRGLEAFFQNNKVGLIECRGYIAGVTKISDAFYMFDAHPCSLNGSFRVNGVACITRFADLKDLAKLYHNNVPKIGDGTFVIHAYDLMKAKFSRKRQPDKPALVPQKLGGFKAIMPGKEILSGTIEQKPQNFEKDIQLHSPAVAFVALAMSALQKVETWTSMVVDEVLADAEILYKDSLRGQGFRYNQWKDAFSIRHVNKDFLLGNVKVNVDVQMKGIKGFVTVKSQEPILNLRKGLEEFFQSNTHGILVIDKIVLPVWEEVHDNVFTIYIFDPNQRGSTGLPAINGHACLLRFCNAKLASDHLISCYFLDGDGSKVRFDIYPVDVVAGALKMGRKKKSPAMKPLTQCVKAKIAANDEKKRIRAIAEEERIAEAKKKEGLLGRMKFHKLSDNVWILRGTQAISSHYGIGANFVAIAMSQISKIDSWTYKNIQMILVTGKQLFIDSCVAAKVPEREISLSSMLRKFVLNEFECVFMIYKPIVYTKFNADNVNLVLMSFLQNSERVMIEYERKCVTVFAKGGFYYLFDPYSRDLEGNSVKHGGTACLMKMGDTKSVADKIYANFCGDLLGESRPFSTVYIDITSLKKLSD